MPLLPAEAAWDSLTASCLTPKAGSRNSSFISLGSDVSSRLGESLVAESPSRDFTAMYVPYALEEYSIRCLTGEPSGQEYLTQFPTSPPLDESVLSSLDAWIPFDV